ncbi:MAG: gliding motility-associated C-terminal domain-containing protein [Prolixibacteraceae bacterium]|jgi:hypothetical protein|nr:gliding motility-associated C-terminal domain-containing protein [Prolixibacteraceae bacterium]
MFLKRLSIALCSTMCFGTLLIGANPESPGNANPVEEENSWMAPEALGAFVTPNDISCYDEGDGSIDVTITLGSAPFYYELRYASTNNLVPGKSNNVITTDFTINGLAAGSYKVYIEDSSGGDPWTSNPQVIEEPSEVIVDLINFEPIECNGNFGRMDFAATSDVGGFTYYAMNSPLNSSYDNTDGEFEGLPAGNYTVWATDANNCTSYYVGDDALKFTEPSNLNNINVIPGQITCFDETGSATVTGLPDNTGVDAYNIELRNNRTGSTSYSLISNNVFTNLDYGDYTLTVGRDGCTPVTRPFEIFQFEDIEIDYSVSDFILCYGEKVSVVVTINGGQTDEKATIYLISNDGDDTNDRFSPLKKYTETHTFNEVSEGSYTIKVVDNNNPDCFETTSSFIIPGAEDPLLFNSDPVGLDASCFGESDGTIQFSVSGGATPYKYFVDGTEYSDPSNILLSANTYSVYIEDDNGCTTETKPVTISQPNQLTVSLVPGSETDVTCPGGNDGSAEFEISEGTEPYSYNLTGSMTRSNQADAELNIGGLVAGDYTLEVFDKNNCTANTVNFSIEEPSELYISYFDVDPDVFCYGSTTTLSVSVSGGSVATKTYTLTRDNWSETETGNGIVEFDSLISGTYNLKVTGDILCESKDTSFTIQAPTQIIINNFNDSLMVDCPSELADLELDIIGATPLTYMVDGGSIQNYSQGTPISGLSASLTGQTHVIEIFDVNGCSKKTSVTVYEPEGLWASMPIAEPVKCKGGATGNVSLTVTGGTSGYEVTLTGASGKVFTESSSQGAIVVNNLPADTYELQVTDKNGCMLSAPITGIEVKEPANSFEIQDPVYSQEIKCFGEAAKLTLTATGGWSVDKEIHVTGSHGVDLTQYSGSEFELLGGTYLVTATNEDGCDDDTTIIVEQPDSLKISATHTDFTCSDSEDAEIVITVADNAGVPGYSYGISGIGSGGENEFTGNTATISTGLLAQTYFIEVQDANNCRSNIVEIEIEKPDPITFEVQRDSFVSCYGASDGKINILNASGSWDTGYMAWIAPAGGAFEQTNYPVIRNLPAGNFEVKLSNREETCFSEPVDVTIKEPTPLSFLEDEFEITHLQCYDIPKGKLVVKASGGLPFDLEYRIANGGNYDSGYKDENTFENLPSGFYDVWIRIKDNDQCVLQYSVEYDKKIEIENPEELIIDTLIVNSFRCRDDAVRGSVQIIAQGGVGIKTYYLSDAPERITDNPNTSGEFFELGEFGQNSTTYHFYVTDENGCQTDEQSFNIINPQKLEILSWEKFDALCHNDRNGSIDLTIVGGTIESSYSVSDLLQPSLTYTIEQKTENNYIIKNLGSSNPDGAEYQPLIKDDNGCEVQIPDPVLIENPEEVDFTVSIDSAKCNGDTDDRIILHAVGGTGTFYYSLDGGNNYGALYDSIFVDEPEGLKQPYVVDENNCADPEPVPEFYYEEPAPFEVRFTKQGIMCYEDEFGNVVLDLVGGTGNYYLSVNDKDFNTSGSFSNPYEITRARTDTTTYDLLNNFIELPEKETFSLYLKDANGCHVQNIEGVNTVQKPVMSTVFERPKPLILLDDPVPYPVTCAGDQSGRIRFHAEGGSFPNYVFSATKLQDPYQDFEREFNRAVNSDGYGEVNKLFAGTYRCVLTDKNNCQAYYQDISTELSYIDVEIDAQFDSISVQILDTIRPVCDSKGDGELVIDVYNYMDLGVSVKLEKLNYGSGIYQIHKQDTATYLPEHGFETHNEDFATFNVLDTLLGNRLGIGAYRIVAQDNRSTCTDTIVFDLFSEYGSDCPPVTYYNWFSPHSGNDTNNEWSLNNTEFEEYLLQIYTSYGDLVYSKKGNSDEDNIKWDGLDDMGKPAPVGTYIYILQKSNGVRDTIINGNVSIIRNVYK